MRLSDPALSGIWPAVLIETRGDGHIDLAAMDAATGHFVSAGVDGVYTADTASEFYTMEYEEWNEVATWFREVTRRRNIPAGIGCTWTNQAGILRRIDRAVQLGYHNIHLSQPYWIRLNAEAQRDFWTAVAEHAGSKLAIVVYAGSQNQLPLDGRSVQTSRQYCPAIAGTKTPGFDAVATNSLLTLCPELAHFVHESVLAPWVALGAAGNPSSLAALSPLFMVNWFRLLRDRQWDQAFAIQRRVNLFFTKRRLSPPAPAASSSIKRWPRPAGAQG